MSEYKRLDRSRPAVIVSHRRSGGTFLARCLDSHPMIRCELNEPLGVFHVSNYRRARLSTDSILDIVLGHQQFEVSMAKILCHQLVQDTKAQTYLLRRDVPVIFLTRPNWLRVALSDVIRHQPGRPTHAFYDRPDRQKVTLNPKMVVDLAWFYKIKTRQAREIIFRLKLPVLFLEYKDLIGEIDAEVEEIHFPTMMKICNFLGVCEFPLSAPEMRKVSRVPEDIENWEEIKEEIRGTKLEGFIKEIETCS